jgi:hypothetical protein
MGRKNKRGETRARKVGSEREEADKVEEGRKGRAKCPGSRSGLAC